jgi:hypothetical protein
VCRFLFEQLICIKSRGVVNYAKQGFLLKVSSPDLFQSKICYKYILDTEDISKKNKLEKKRFVIRKEQKKKEKTERRN